MPAAATRRPLVQLFQVLCKVIISATGLAVMPAVILRELQQQTVSAVPTSRTNTSLACLPLRHRQGGEQQLPPGGV